MFNQKVLLSKVYFSVETPSAVKSSELIKKNAASLRELAETLSFMYRCNLLHLISLPEGYAYCGCIHYVSDGAIIVHMHTKTENVFSLTTPTSFLLLDSASDTITCSGSDDLESIVTKYIEASKCVCAQIMNIKE